MPSEAARAASRRISESVFRESCPLPPEDRRELFETIIQETESRLDALDLDAARHLSYRSADRDDDDGPVDVEF